MAELKDARRALYTDPRFGSPRLHRRGRIEGAMTGPFTEGGCGVLHGFTAVAELKGSHLSRFGMSDFTVLHGFTAVAELKGCAEGGIYGRQAGVLHGFTAVAELKERLIVLVYWLRFVLHGFTAVAELKALP